MSFASNPAFAEQCAREAALIRRKCPYCERRLRPCNLGRHIDARHYRQLTIFDLLDDLEAQSKRAA